MGKTVLAEKTIADSGLTVFTGGLQQRYPLLNEPVINISNGIRILLLFAAAIGQVAWYYVTLRQLKSIVNINPGI